MARHPLSAKPVTEPMLMYCSLGQNTVIKKLLQYIWKLCLENVYVVQISLR